MEIIDLIKNRRTIRRFERKGVPRDILVELCDLARLAPSAMNMQPLEYIVVDDDDKIKELFAHAHLAGFRLEDERPKETERPGGYIVVLVNTGIMKNFYERDVGAAVENILLGAIGYGLGGCFIYNMNRKKINALLGVPETHIVDSVVALGYPAEESRWVELEGDDLKYWKDSNGVQNVPKRKLEKLLHIDKF